MKAVVVSEFGGPDQLRLADTADPVPGEGQVRVAVHAAGANPVDAFNRADGGWAGLQVPCILGYDVAGVVDWPSWTPIRSPGSTPAHRLPMLPLSRSPPGLPTWSCPG